MAKNVASAVRELLLPTAEALGYILWDVEYQLLHKSHPFSMISTSSTMMVFVSSSNSKNWISTRQPV